MSRKTSRRTPVVVTFSLATLTPCCQGDGRGPTPPEQTSAPPDTAVTAAPTPAPQPPSAPPTAQPSASQAPLRATQAWPFEREPNIVNPKAGDKVVLWNGTDACYTLGAEDERTSGIQFARHPVPCPDGIEKQLASCIGSILRREGASCSCGSPEGNPPRPPETVACP